MSPQNQAVSNRKGFEEGQGRSTLGPMHSPALEEQKSGSIWNTSWRHP